ncbi:unnamed protein product [Acanthoscelides obtectus]|nr:unnamed protein product [Acanthoscelides obtectus]CAK1652583.1 Rab3 GTPase-activating protein catalytic subunit [Acanthoscelides obtectus]
MNEEIDDTEFYQQDFTTASEWEIFIARMEEIINQWKTDELNNEAPVQHSGIWEIKTEKITFADFEFDLLLYKKTTEYSDSSESSDENEKQTKNPIDTLYDFELYNANNDAEHSFLSAWYGLDEYYVLASALNIGINTESKIKILLSSAYIVSSSPNCERPIFVQIRDTWQRCYLGVYEGDCIRTNFEMVHLKRGPGHCYYLNGLLDMFKTKIMSPASLDSITVSVQLKYILREFGRYEWKQDLSESENFNVDALPFGVTVEPIHWLTLRATWNHLADNLVMDSEGHSDFDPMTAPKWSCSARMHEPVCLLGDALSAFLNNLEGNTTVYDILGDYATLPSAESNPLDLLTEPAVPTITSLLAKAARRSSKSTKGTPPITESVLVPLLYYLFPDADENPSFPYGGKEDKDTAEKTNEKGMSKNFEEEFKGFKTCTKDSLTWRLSIVLTHALQSLGGVKAVAHIWYEFVQEMRYRWEKSMPIPG